MVEGQDHQAQPGDLSPTMSLVPGCIRGQLHPTALEAAKVSWHQRNGSSTSHHGGKGLCPQQRQSCELCQQVWPEHRDKGSSEE